MKPAKPSKEEDLNAKNGAIFHYKHLSKKIQILGPAARKYQGIHPKDVPWLEKSDLLKSV